MPDIHAHCGAVVYLRRDSDPPPTVDNHCGFVIIVPENNPVQFHEALAATDRWQDKENKARAEADDKFYRTRD